jgi:hypothetical protein
MEFELQRPEGAEEDPVAARVPIRVVGVLSLDLVVANVGKARPAHRPNDVSARHLDDLQVDEASDVSRDPTLG